MKLDYVIVAGGCFWGLEDLLRSLDGVTSTKVGYSGGDFDDPTYADIITGKTGHAEAVRVEYDQDEISLEEILHYFFKIHDPTTKNRQGNDVGTSYRSAAFYRDDAQKAIIENVIDEVNEIGRFENEVVTTVTLEKEFYDAEAYHQNYLQRNPNGYSCHFERD